MRRAASGIPTRSNHCTALALAAAPESAVWRSMTSTICWPTVITGFRLVAGSWKMMLMRRPRILRMLRSGRPMSSVPSSVTVPAATRPLSGSKRSKDRAVMDLPQPDSPTRAKVCPLSMVSDKASTARTRPLSEASSVLSCSIAIMRPPWRAPGFGCCCAPERRAHADQKPRAPRRQTRSWTRPARP